MLNEEFSRIGTVLTSNVWTKHVYKTKDMNSYAGPYDCANECKNIEKDNSCQFIALVVRNVDFIKPWSHFTFSWFVGQQMSFWQSVSHLWNIDQRPSEQYSVLHDKYECRKEITNTFKPNVKGHLPKRVFSLLLRNHLSNRWWLWTNVCLYIPCIMEKRVDALWI